MADFSEQQLKAAYRRGQWNIAWILVRAVIFCGLVLYVLARAHDMRAADTARLERINSRIDYLVNQLNALARKEAGRSHDGPHYGAEQQ